MHHHATAKFAGFENDQNIKVDFSDDIQWNGKSFRKQQLSWLSPVTGTIYGTVFNFKEQVKAMKDQFYEKPYNKPPKRPVLYIKPSNTITGHQKPVPVPQGIENIEVNATLGVVIGKNATCVLKKEAFDYVAGYTIVNDVSIPHDSFFRPDIKNKVRDGFCPIGPWMMNRGEVSNPDSLAIRTYLNGDLIQENNTKDLVQPIGTLLSEVTQFMTLHKGDMLLVGIPHHAPTARSGDIIRIEIEGIGSLENPVVDEELVIPGGGM